MSVSRRALTAFSRQTSLASASTQRNSQPSYICPSCRRSLHNPNTPSRTPFRHRPNPVISTSSSPSAILARSLSTTPGRHKKSSASKKSSRHSPDIGPSSSSGDSIPANKATQSRDSEIDPYDYTSLEAAIQSALTRLKDSLARTRDAGRVTAEMLESLPVELNIKHTTTTTTTTTKGGTGSAHHERTLIRDLGSVVPKGGRAMQIFCAEEANVKPITNAVAASEHSLVPSVDENNNLLVVVPVPPATAETRSQAAAEAKKVMDKASLEVRNARGDAQKRFRRMELEKLVIKDELVRAHKGMEEVVRKGQDEVKRLFDQALKSLQQ